MTDTTAPRRVQITTGPDGDPVLSNIPDTTTDAEEVEQILIPGEDKVTVKHTYCWVGGGHQQYTQVAVELTAQTGETIADLFERTSVIAVNGVLIAADQLADQIKQRKESAR